MSKHHHHPHEGHSAGNAPGTGRRSHGPRFYLAGLCLFIALVCFIIWGAMRGPATAVGAPLTAPQVAPAH
jgi:hypothetical protein